MNMRRTILVPFWLLMILVAALGLLLMALSFVLGKTEKGPIAIGYNILYEVGKAAFIGSTVGIFIRSFLSKPSQDQNNTPLSQCGIDAVYVNREEAHSLFLSAVRDNRTRKISVIGISLREFLLNGKLKDIWDAICDRLRIEMQSNIPESDRLSVRLLLLDPTCPEGDFRVQVEKQLPVRLNKDVPLALQTIRNLLHELEKGQNFSLKTSANTRSVLEARLYQHGSFAFQFITNSFAIVEQYAYQDRSRSARMPLLQYRRFSDAYEQLVNSYDIIWESTRLSRNRQPEVGVGQAIRESRLVGIYRQEDRGHLGARQQDILRSSRPGEIISIQALSGRFYLQQIIGDVQAATSPAGRSAKIRLLIVNPTSRGAILRAVADSTPIENIGDAISCWTWQQHTSSNLYIDVHSAIHRFENLRDAGCDIELRLSASEPPCSMLLAPGAIFIEQYAYGRSRNFRRGIVLGGEYAVFEYDCENNLPKTSEERILQSAFEVLWDSYSISADEYRARISEEQQFTSELEALLSQIDGEGNDRDISMVILAAGYGTRLDTDRIPNMQGKPKALLPVAGKPMLEWLLGCVKDIPEIRQIILVTNEKYVDQFEDLRGKVIEPTYRSIKIISDGSRTNADRRGATGALHFAITREELKGNVLVAGADNFFDGNFRNLVDTFLTKKKGCVVIHDEGSKEKIAGRLGVVSLDNEGRIVDFEEKPDDPKSTYASTLCYILTRQNLQYLKGYAREGSHSDNSGEFIKHLVREGERLEAYRFEGEWFDIGTLAEYQSLCDFIGRSKTIAQGAS